MTALLRKAAFLFVLFFPLIVKGQTDYYLAPAPTGDNGNTCLIGDPCATLDHIMTLVADGDNVYIENGSYGGNPVIDHPITLFQNSGTSSFGIVTLNADIGVATGLMEAAVIYVNPGGVIQDAVNFSPSGGGGYIDVSTGTYNETVTFNKDLTFTSDSDPITITNIVMDNDATLTTDANMTISGSVTLTDGIIDAQATFYLGTSATDIVETTGNYITGTITMSSRAVGVTSPFEFLGFNIAHAGDLGNVTITRTSGSGGIITGSGGDTSIECHWDVTTDNAPVNNGLITLKWLPAWLNGISDPTIHQDDGSDWVALDDGGGTDGTDGDYTTYVANAFTTTLGSFTIADPSDVLPVELTYLKVTNQLDHILLHWQTASEINHDYFEIQRSKNGEKFEALDRMSSHHNSSSTHNYQWKDFNPLAGKSYYRLKMVDFDGYTEYSPIVSASAANQSLALHPNPTSNVLNIHSDIEANHVAVFNAIGKQIDLAVKNQQIDVSSLLPGVYMLKLISNSEVIQARFVKE